MPRTKKRPRRKSRLSLCESIASDRSASTNRSRKQSLQQQPPSSNNNNNTAQDLQSRPSSQPARQGVRASSIARSVSESGVSRTGIPLASATNTGSLLPTPRDRTSSRETTEPGRHPEVAEGVLDGDEAPTTPQQGSRGDEGLETDSNSTEMVVLDQDILLATEDDTLPEASRERRAPNRSPGGDSVSYPPSIRKSDNHEEDEESRGLMEPPPPRPPPQHVDTSDASSLSVLSRFFQSLEEYTGRETWTSESSLFSSLEEDRAGGTSSTSSRSLSHVSVSASATCFSEEELDNNRFPVSASALAAQTSRHSRREDPSNYEAEMVERGEHTAGPSSTMNPTPQPGNSYHLYDWFLPDSSRNDDTRETDDDSADSNRGEVGSTVGDKHLGFPCAAASTPRPQRDNRRTSGNKAPEESREKRKETESSNENDKEEPRDREGSERHRRPEEKETPRPKRRTTTASSSREDTASSTRRLRDEQPRTSSSRTARVGENRRNHAEEDEAERQREVISLLLPPHPASNRVSTSSVASDASSGGRIARWGRSQSRSSCGSNASEHTRQRREKERGICTPTPRTPRTPGDSTTLPSRDSPSVAKSARERDADEQDVGDSPQPPVQQAKQRRRSRHKSVDPKRSRSAPSMEYLLEHRRSTIDIRQSLERSSRIRDGSDRNEVVDPISRLALPVSNRQRKSTTFRLPPPLSPPSPPWNPENHLSADRLHPPHPSPPRDQERREDATSRDGRHNHEPGTVSQHYVRQQEELRNGTSSRRNQPPPREDASSHHPQLHSGILHEPQGREEDRDSEHVRPVRSETSEFATFLKKHLQELRAWREGDSTLAAEEDLESGPRPEGGAMEGEGSVEELVRGPEATSPGPSSQPRVDDEMEDEFRPGTSTRIDYPSCSMSYLQARRIRSPEGTPKELQMLFVRCRVFNTDSEAPIAMRENTSNHHRSMDNGSVRDWNTPSTYFGEPVGFTSDVSGVDNQCSRASPEHGRCQQYPCHLPHHGDNRESRNTNDYSFRRRARYCQRRRKQSRPMSNAEREIRRLRNTVNPLIPFAPFARLVREFLLQMAPSSMRCGMRVQRNAILALREASEMYLVQLFEDASLCTAHGNRVTLQPRDLRLVRRLRRIFL